MSAHAFTDPTIRQKLEAKGEPFQAISGGQTILETATSSWWRAWWIWLMGKAHCPKAVTSIRWCSSWLSGRSNKLFR